VTARRRDTKVADKLRDRAEIMAAFDRVAKSTERDHHLVEARGAWLDGFMCVVAGTVVDRFTIPSPWSDAAIRKVLAAIVEAAPSRDLAKMLKDARGELEMILEFESERADPTKSVGQAALGRFAEAYKPTPEALERYR
jgi:hypothetical protein